MNDHNLDDLIIGEPHHGGGRSKSVLSLVALLLIILIVGIVLVKLILGGDETELAPQGESPELTQVVHPAMQEKTQQHSAAAKEQIPEELKPITEEHLTPPPVTPPKARAEAPAARRTPVEKRPAQAKPKPVPPKAPATAPKPRTQPSPAAAKPAPSPRELFKKPAATAKKIYYVQVGSFKRPPTKKFLEEIKAKGYKPIIVRSGQMIKVRVGPFASYADAKAKLPEIKEKLGIAGFVVRKK